MIIRNLLEVTIEVSILILLIELIRKIFKKYINPNVMYFLWIFVAVSIIIPIRLEFKIEAPNNVQNVVNEIPVVADVQLVGVSIPFVEDEVLQTSNSSDDVVQKEISIEILLYIIWGSVAMILTIYIMTVNIRLFFYARKKRKPLDRKIGNVPIYSLRRYNCLMGLFHPTIYVDIKGLKEKSLIENVIKHEYQHYKAKDHIWQLLRTICLILQWHNPLVWWAYFASKHDGELACDARVLKNLSQEERYLYADSLLKVLERTSRRSDKISMVTSMGESKSRIKERIESIMKYKHTKTFVLAVIIVCVVGAFCSIGCRVVGVGKDSLGHEKGAGGIGQLIVENVVYEKEPLVVNIQDYYSTNIGDPSNLYHIDENKVLWGCGRNNCGQLGQGTQDYDFHEEPMKIAENVVHVDFSQQDFAIYLTEEGDLYGMGTAATGVMKEYEEISAEMLINREHYIVSTPKLLMEDVIYASCGRYDIVCLLQDGSVWILGTVWWQYGGGSYVAVEPEKILDNAVMVTGGLFNHAALLEDGSVWTWGYNYAGSCGVPGTKHVSEPVKVAENVLMVWTGRTKYNSEQTNIADFNGEYEHFPENTIILKEDGSYWACGVGLGEETYLDRYWEVNDLYVVCSYEFVPVNSMNDF